jgi:hypothetical protein
MQRACIDARIFTRADTHTLSKVLARASPARLTSEALGASERLRVQTAEDTAPAETSSPLLKTAATDGGAMSGICHHRLSSLWSCRSTLGAGGEERKSGFPAESTFTFAVHICQINIVAPAEGEVHIIICKEQSTKVLLKFP